MIGIVIGGPTGVGKTSLSIKLAKILDAVIINCDSMQIYKHMDIGTAKITEKEKEGVEHYMFDIVEPIDRYNVGDYYRDVNSLLKKFEKDNRNVILVGGTGLYINSIVRGLSKLPEADLNIRNSLEKLSTEELYEKLKELDEEAAKEIHPNNRVRVERAVEVCLLTGDKFSKLNKLNIKDNNYNFIQIALERDRKILYDRIDYRVELMIENGLVEEAKDIYEKYNSEKNKIKAIGYKELFDYFDGLISVDEAIEIIKKESRHYAKRQFTWFKGDADYKWFDLGQITEDEIIKKILNFLNIFKS
ncbi:MAG: tRNA (adenosine(37)-N6)-dimethylallyltransferase MiaA [Fusobacteriaceae bacterium]|mgnify:FL=1|nr:tRNA (adenosine(37)-N6)-dimethylallyltransferase MiaA [Fusobacteriaceae bacterium]MBU9917252.1 tRNA (adenosine(37)-N6)-dimethylallyltransferase MiaA [Fusobacteriaceae bacterium]